ncbi:MAG TPA: hypothetical protein VID07_07795 [Actinomycetes bacterium]
MSRTHRALTVLALSAALAIGTTTVAVAAQPIPSAVEDQNDRLLRNVEAAAADRTQAAVEQVRAGERAFAAEAVATDVNAERKALYQSQLAQNQTAQATDVNAQRKALYQSQLAQNLASRPATAAPAEDQNDRLIVLLALVGVLIGGAAVVAGTAASRRRHRVVAA